ncbi:SRPBCC domain-containing protein [Dactylosporangium aurantiacum]|uniref:SRPBCC domain-containing protein n=1 Tax=Dactylosporangium aurantiacum TaxID=35754 RepID=A0A9Q9IMB1_9ACTN|nr:SRPBCC domain-containing protein [Dactylosporangium aurantiacum]MDG6106339.1 SRPBCC domain-containing protein [Dactylosporangium aurantiacum]UWZ58171.1 SRPBCC domain-containing protein [Dactylosporangium aurantiacum]
MTTGEPDKVVPLRGRAPIRQTIVIRSDIEHTFTVFTRDIGRWWPTQPFSLGTGKVVDVRLDGRPGGRVYELWADGTEVDWGEILVWEPPARFAMTWTTLPVVTEVELHFRALGPAVTRVELEHRGWDRLSTEQLAAVVDMSAQYGGYEGGWTRILAELRTAAETIEESA